MRLLILGGTQFLGRFLVQEARSRGHQVTLFNRGKHAPGLFPDLEELRGDRDGGLAVLEGRRWDAVIDTCGYVPRLVGDSASLLATAVEHYTFISTISVYADFSTPFLDEQAPLARLAGPPTEEITGESYGPLKALCEEAAERAMPGRVLHVRPGLIVGPYDPTDRFTYWPVRVAEGGRVLAPGRPERPVQFIDVRDLAAWTVRMVEAGRTGAYNATGPQTVLSMADLLAACRAAAGSDAEFVWIDDQELLARGASPWMEVPLWVPELSGLLQVDILKAVAEGLVCRSPIETARDTLAWHRSRPADGPAKAGMTRAREAELLADRA